MKHQIIGAGVVGKATGIWLKANNENVIFYDKNNKLLLKLEKEGLTTTLVIRQDVDIYWICTAEWNVEEVVRKICQVTKQEFLYNQKIIVIRSTTSPGTVKDISERFNLEYVVHNPEFLRANTALEDVFNPDRIIIGTESDGAAQVLKKLYAVNHVPIVITDPTTSELIKLVANSWLSTQITFWNCIYELLDLYSVNPQEVVYGCTFDKRISKYGTKMMKKPFVGFCLPKDLDTIIGLLDNKEIAKAFFNSIKEVNESLVGIK